MRRLSVLHSTRVDGEEAEREKRKSGEREAEKLVGGAAPCDVNGGVAGREWEGDEAVIAMDVSGEQFTVARDAPGWVVAEIEDEGLGGREIDS